jgi:integrase/recombinase XerC
LAQVENVENLVPPTDGDEDAATVNLRAMRDRAFLLTLADTGLRVHEACNLRRGDIDWNEGRAIIIGKGNKQAVIRFTSRAIQLDQRLPRQRSSLDGNSGRQLTSLPIFARHDKAREKRSSPSRRPRGATS